MNKKIALLCISFLFSVSTTTGWIWQKTEKENINQEYQVNDTCQITVYNTEGSITIKPWPQNKILIEAVKQGTAEEQENTTIAAKASGHEASIITRLKKKDQKSSKVEYTLMVPEHAVLDITQTSGPITVRGIHGNITASVEQGIIKITDSTKTVSAKTGKGSIEVQQKKFGQPSCIFLTSMQGSITLSLPRETRAALHAKVGKGSIKSEHPVSFAVSAQNLNEETWERIRKQVDGTLGAPNGELKQEGAPITLEVTTGSITLKEY